MFRNTQGKAWKPVTGRGRFLQIKATLGWDKDPVRRRYSCLSCRHTFAHRMLSGYWNGGAGCSIETLAELIGDTPKVAFDHYGRPAVAHQEPCGQPLALGPTCMTNRGTVRPTTLYCEAMKHWRPLGLKWIGDLTPSAGGVSRRLPQETGFDKVLAGPQGLVGGWAVRDRDLSSGLPTVLCVQWVLSLTLDRGG